MVTKQSLINLDPIQIIQFKRRLFDLSVLLRELGIAVSPYQVETSPYNSSGNSKTAQAWLRLNDLLDNYYRALSASYGQAQSEGSSQILWYVLKELGLAPPDDLFFYLTDEHIVEIYGLDGCQIYRNLNFFKYCSYTLEELYLHEWSDLFERCEGYTQQVAVEAMKIFTGVYKKTTPITFGKQRVIEKFSSQKYILAGEICYLAPLYIRGTSQIGGGIAISKVDILGSLVEQPELFNAYDVNANPVNPPQVELEPLATSP